MSKKQYIDKFFDIDISDSAITIGIKDISWQAPYEPEITTNIIATLAPDTNDKTIDNVINDTLNNPAYFITCAECNELNLKTHMYDDLLCPACASINHGMTN